MKINKRKNSFFHRKKETIITCSTVNYAAKEIIYELTSSPKLKSPDVALTFQFDSPIFFQESELKGLIHLAVKPKEQSVGFIRIEVQILGISKCRQGHPTYTVPKELVEHALNTTSDYSIAIQHTQGIPVAFEMDLYGQGGGPGRQSTSQYKVNYYIYANAIYQLGDKVKQDFAIKTLQTVCLLSFRDRKWLGGESISVNIKVENYGYCEINQLIMLLFKRITLFNGPLGKKYQLDASSRAKKHNSIRKDFWKCVQKEEICEKRKNEYCKWQGVSTLETHTMDCHIRIPEKEVSINVGSDFQVEYVLQILVGTKWRTLNCIKMPLQIIPACAPSVGQDARYVDVAPYNSEGESIILPQNPSSEFHRVSYEPYPTTEHVSTHDYVFFG